MKKMFFALVALIMSLGAVPVMAGELYSNGTYGRGYADAEFSGGSMAYGDFSTTSIYGKHGSIVVSRTTNNKACVRGNSGVKAGTGGYYENDDYGYSTSGLSIDGSGFGFAKARKKTNVEGYGFTGNGEATSVGHASGDYSAVIGESTVYGSGKGGFKVNAPSDRWNGSDSSSKMVGSANGGAYASGKNHASASSQSATATSSSTN